MKVTTSFFLSFLTAHTHTHTKLKTLETLGRMMKKMKMEMRGNECDGEENDEGMEVMEQNFKELKNGNTPIHIHVRKKIR